VANFVVDNYPQATVITTWPATSILGWPFAGYVDKGIELLPCATTAEGERVKQILLSKKTDSVLLIFPVDEEGPRSCYRQDKFILEEEIGFESLPEMERVRIYSLRSDKELD